MLSKQELESLFDGEESESFERKESYTPDKIGKAICAFANDLSDNRQSGVIFIGQKNNKECADLSVTDDLLRKISSRNENQISPVPVISVKSATIRDCKIVYIKVEPAQNPPVRFNKCIYIRSGTETRATKEEEDIRLTQKQYQNQQNSRFFDQRKPYLQVTLDELDLQLIKGVYLHHTVSAEILMQNNRSPKERLASLRFLTEDGVPNNAAVLCFCSNPRGYVPGAYIQFVRIKGDDIASPVLDHEEINGNIFQQIRIAEEKLKAHTSTTASFGEGLREETSDYPMIAISQALRNAVMHRDYENSSAPVRCNWFDDRIEITSPGSVFGRVTPDNFGHPDVTDYRNPIITEALKQMGFVEKFGAGIAIIKKTMAENGNPPPEFIAHEKHVQVILWRKT